jgi:hypothetical protein
MFSYKVAHVQIGLNDYVHFQWTGSLFNSIYDAGVGRDRTDKNNIVQIAGPGRTLPLALNAQTMFPNSSVAYVFANLGTPEQVRLTSSVSFVVGTT